MADIRESGAVPAADGRRRCPWAGTTAEYQAYHDGEWGRPVADDVRLYEKLCLEGFQSGLSWLTILRKRPAFRQAFAGGHSLADSDYVLIAAAACEMHPAAVLSAGRQASVRRSLRPEIFSPVRYRTSYLTEPNLGFG